MPKMTMHTRRAGRFHASRAGCLLGRSLVVAAAAWAGLTVELSADAAPGNPTVVRGNVTFETVGNRTIIRASNGAIINHLNFNIAPGDLVRFIQPGQMARVLNRITGPEPTHIQGRLLANGQVYLVNPAGVMFGPDAVVNTGGLWVGAGHMRDQDFISGRNAFVNLTGPVINQGKIVGGQVHLAGDSVANHGSIAATGRGIITMVAGDDVVIRQHGEKISVHVDGQRLTNQANPRPGHTTPDLTANPGVENTGQVRASHGSIVLGAGDLYAMAIRNTGSIQAPKGEVTVAAVDGLVHNAAGAEISANSPHGAAGDVTVQAPSVLNQGRVSADANHGDAGRVEVTSDDHTYLTDSSRISAAAHSGHGQGGEILVHSYRGETVAANGSLVDVSGGASGGDGGFVEVSGARLTFNGQAYLRARAGSQRGTLLLDPNHITISDLGADDSFLADGVINFAEPNTTDDLVISDESLEAIVGNIILEAMGSITVDHQVDLVNNNNVLLNAFGDITLNQAINGANNLHLAGNWASNIYINVPLNLTGDLTVDGERGFLGGGTITTGGEQHYLARINLASDMTLTGARVQFHQSLDDDVPGEQFLVVNGPGPLDARAVFDGPVGQRRRLEHLLVNGTSEINGGLVKTSHFQRYMDAVTLGADTLLESTEAGEIRFVTSLDGPVDLVVETAGLTRFDGPVGHAAALESITTDAPGRTHISAHKIAGVLDYNDPVSLGADSRLDATTSVDFAQTIDGRGHDLVINSPSTTFNGAATRLGLLNTDADGRTFIGADISGRTLDFDDPVSLFSDATLTGRALVDFDQTLDGPHHAMIVSDRRIRFGGDVGGSDLPLSLTASVTNPDLLDDNLILIDDHLIRAVGDIHLNPGGRSQPARVASIAARNFAGARIVSQQGSIFMGPNEKLTALGDLKIFAPGGSVTLGDLNAYGSLLVDSPDIRLFARQAGKVRRFDGSLVDDQAASFIVFNTAQVTSQPTVFGDGADPIFAARLLSNLQGPLGDFIRARFAELSEQHFIYQNTVLDLAPPAIVPPLPPPPPPFDPPTVNLATALTDSPARLRDFVPRDPFAVRSLEGLSLAVRPMNSQELTSATSGRELYDDQPSDLSTPPAHTAIAANRLRRDSMLRSIDRHASLFAADAAGEPSAFIKTVLSRAWEKYQQDNAGADASGWRTYLASQPDHAEALGYLDGLRGLFRELHTMGATRLELRRSLDGVLRPITPDAITQADLELAINASELG